MIKVFSYTAVCLILLLIGFPTRAEAYLDPGTGSIVLQVAIGGILAAMATTRLYWKRLRSLFRRTRDVDSTSPPSER
jgi:hypothetical protein